MQKTIFNIFKKRIKPEKQSKEVKITVDIHEKNSGIIAELESKQAKVEIKPLQVGDYQIAEIVIERKTTADLISSLISKRLLRQIIELKKCRKKVIILEGNPEQTSFNKNALRGLILDITLEQGIPIIYTKNLQETAEYLLHLSKKSKERKDIDLHSKKGLSKKEQMEYILQSFKGIGPKTSKKLLKKYKNLRKIMNLEEEIIKKEIGKKYQSFQILKEEY